MDDRRDERDADTLGGMSAATVLEAPSSAHAEPPEPEPPAGLRTGASVGRYVVLEEIGQGGMGRVVRAYDPKLQREVALKEVHGRALGPEGARRIVAEARAMAKLSHPNVVAVYDVEALPDGRLVIVMEYVAGATLRAWLEADDRDSREVIGRFVAAGRGLAAAHATGLLHRDFKPANVLVGEGELVKVTDFGLAKIDPTWESTDGASPQELTDGNDLTRSGIVLGTPRYMAPEQHLGATLSPAADQYAFCVSLWEALVGTPPFPDAPLVLAKQKGPPPWPSTTAVPRRIVDAIRRGLAPRPEDRWPKMEALLAVLARGEGKRRRLGWLAAGALALAAFGVARAFVEVPPQQCTGAADALVEVWGEPRRADVRAAVLGVDAPFAPAVWERTAAELDRYAAGWIEQHTEACAATTIRGEQSADVLDLRMACLHRARVDLEAVVGVLASADADVVGRAHEVVGRLRPLDRCADVEALRADVEPPLPEDADEVEAIRVLVAESDVEERAGRFGAARAKIEAARVALESVAYEPVRTEVEAQLGSVLEQQGEGEASEAVLLVALERASALRQWELLRDVAASLMFVVGRNQMRMSEALRYRELSLGLARGDRRAEMVARTNIGTVLHLQGKYLEAEAEQRRAIDLGEALYGPNHHEAAASRMNLGATLQAQGRFAEAQAELERAVAAYEAEFGPDHIRTADARHNVGVVLERLHRFAEAEAVHRSVLAVRLRALGPDHPDVGRSRTGLASALRQLGNHRDAEAEYRKAIGVLTRAHGPEHRDVLVTRANLAAALLDQERLDEAVQEYRSTIAAYERAVGAHHPEVASARLNLANVLVKQGDMEGAEAEQRRALALLEQALGEDHLSVALAQSNLARVLLELGKPEDALPFAQKAWTRRQRDDVPPTHRAATAFVLADALWRLHRSAEQRQRARSLAEEALAIFREAGPPFATEATGVEEWLAER